MVNGVNFGSKSGRTTRKQKPNWESINIGEILRHRGKIIGRKMYGAGLEIRIFEYSLFGYMLEIRLEAAQSKTKLVFTDFEEALSRLKEYKRIIELFNREGRSLKTWKELSKAQDKLKRSTSPKL